LDKPVVSFLVGVISQNGTSHKLERFDVVVVVIFTHELKTYAAVQVNNGLLSRGELLYSRINEPDVLV